MALKQIIKLKPTINLMTKQKVKEYDLSNLNKPLVIIFSWFGAKDRYINKYAEQYFSKNYDVLTVRSDFKSIMFTKSGAMENGKYLAKILSTTNVPILVHGFSIGYYTCFEAYHNFANNEKVKRRIKGQIWDSLTPPMKFPQGLSKSLFPVNPTFQKITESLVEVLEAKFGANKLIYERFDKCVKFMLENPLPAPALILFSKDDELNTREFNQSNINSWRDRGVHVDYREFRGSKHLGISRDYNKEYWYLINNHLKKIQFGENNLNILNKNTAILKEKDKQPNNKYYEGIVIRN